MRSTIFPASEEEIFRVPGAAGSTLRVELRPLGKSAFRPSLRCVLSDGLPVEPAARPSGRIRARLAFPVDGTCTLAVGSASGGPGSYRLKARLKPRPAGGRPAVLDLRSDLRPALLRGDYAAFLAFPAPPGLPAVATGEVRFDGSGGLRARLAAVEAGTLPLPGAPAAPAIEVSGSYATDGSVAAVAIDGVPGTGEFTVAAGGDVLAAGFGETDPALLGLLLRREVPTAASLAGTWALVDASGDASGGTLETGSLTLSAAGSVSGLGVRTSFAPGPDGTPVAGEATPLFLLGSFSVALDGTVTLVTRENLFGPTTTREFRPLLGQDLLAGGSEPGAAALEVRALLRQGTGLGSDAVSGDYLHLGVSAGTETALRTGVLAFDGAGAYAGIEAVLPGAAPSPIAVSGAYSVNAAGIATLTPAGEATRTGVVGPDARYLLAFGFGDSGFAFDLLIAAD